MCPHDSVGRIPVVMHVRSATFEENFLMREDWIGCIYKQKDDE